MNVVYHRYQLLKVGKGGFSKFRGSPVSYGKSQVGKTKSTSVLRLNVFVSG